MCAARSSFSHWKRMWNRDLRVGRVKVMWLEGRAGVSAFRTTLMQNEISGGPGYISALLKRFV